MIAEVTIVDRHPASPRGAFLSCPGVSHRPAAAREPRSLRAEFWNADKRNPT